MNPFRAAARITSVAAFSAVLISTVLVACSGGSASLAGPLLRHDTRTGHCFNSTHDWPWERIRRRVTEFGLDDLELPTHTTRAVITSVVLKGVTGHLAIVKAAAMPGQTMGDGFTWGDRDGLLFPPEWRDRQAIPGATLTFAPRRPGYPPADQYNGSIWEIVLGLTPGSTGGGADHLELRYRVGGRNYTFDGNARFGIYPTKRACDRFLNRPQADDLQR